MKLVGQLLVTLGFLAGALCTVVDEFNVPWTYFGVAFFAGAVGVLLIRLETRQAAQAHEVVHLGMQSLRDSLDRIVNAGSRLQDECAALDVYDVHRRIDAEFRDDLMAFADARENMAHAFGLQTYADVMSHFAAGERYLNRVWSASTDGYPDEVNAYVSRSYEQFAAARDLLGAAQRG
jgi:hypothetical protein